MIGDREALARTLWAEARSEGIMGMTAVACVIMNRFDNPGWWSRDRNDDIEDDTIEAVCRDPWQFSAWNPGDPNLPKLLAVNESDAVYKSALAIADACLADQQPDITQGADHYYRAGSKVPNWSVGREPVAHIGKHLFYKIGLSTAKKLADSGEYWSLAA